MLSEQRLNELYKKREKLEKNRMGYLEVDNNSGARRVEKQIEMIDLEIRLFKFEELQQELEIYKNIVKDYPGLQNQIRNKLIENKKENYYYGSN